MQWIFYIVCFLLFGINSRSGDDVPSQQLFHETYHATQIPHNYIISPVQFISEDQDTEIFVQGSGLLFTNYSPANFSDRENGTHHFSPDVSSIVLSAWLIDLPPPAFV
ncbi:MAG TPA: hypothetical protein VEP89_01160 [Draconibacterium sp.]|nr:hypothetical protein [Draconibacterium sp.]